VVVYAHGRQGPDLAKKVSKGWAFTDGFCRELNDDVHDFAESMRKAGWNTLLWYWAQYSYSPCGDWLEDHWLTCGWANAVSGGVISPKIWADNWLRSQDETFGGGNPHWAQFPAVTGGFWSSQTYTWEDTEVGADNNLTQLAVGFGFAESLLNIEPSLADVAALHFVGNSYGSQVVLHGSYLILQQLREGRLGASRSHGIPLPTRIVLLDPAYKAGATRLFGEPGHSIFWHLAVPQLEELHSAGVPVVSVHATDIPNTLIGTKDTAYFNYHALKVVINMGLSGHDAHTACVDWYFKTYLDGECAAPLASVFGCAADASAHDEIMELLNSPQGVMQVMQTEGTSSADPWLTSGFVTSVFSTIEEQHLLDITGCTSLSGSQDRLSEFKCIFPTVWIDSEQAYDCPEETKTVEHEGHEYMCGPTESRDLDKSECKVWCNNLPPIEGCSEITRGGLETSWFGLFETDRSHQVKCIFAADNGGCEKTHITHDGKTYNCTASALDSEPTECEAWCTDNNELDLVPSTLLE